MPMLSNSSSIKLPMEEIERMFEVMGFKKVLEKGASLEVPPVNMKGTPESGAFAEYDKLVADLRENAEWVGDNNYEVPIMLYDNLLAAANAIEKLKSLAENGASAVDTGKRLSSVVALAGQMATENEDALEAACSWIASHCDEELLVSAFGRPTVGESRVDQLKRVFVSRAKECAHSGDKDGTDS